MSLLSRLFFVSLLFSCSLAGQAQQKVPKKAQKALEEAKENYLKLKFAPMEEALNEAIEIFPQYADALIFRAEWRLDKGLIREAANDYRNAYLTDTNAYLGILNLLATLYLDLGHPDSSLAVQESFLNRKKLSDDQRQRLQERLDQTKETLRMMEHPISFNPENLGKEINATDGEYHCSFTIDGKEMIFTVREAYQGGCPVPMMRQEENFYVAFEEQGNWVRRQPLGPPINTPCNEGAGRISPDGNLFFYAASHRDDMIGRMDIYFSKRINGKWQMPQNLGPNVNSPHWDSQPAFSADGKTLYFVSNRPGGLGKEDIWFSEWQEDGSWSPAQNLGPPVNTPENDFSPFLHPNNLDLYFASNGHPGLGGADLFRARKNASGKFETPQNLGYPLNTTQDERSLVISADGLTGYYASNHSDGFGDFDLYRFQTDPSYRPIPVTWMGGSIVAKGALEHTKIELIDLGSGMPTAVTRPDPISGKYLLPVPTGTKYGLNVAAPGFLFHSEYISVESNYEKITPFKKDIHMQAIDTGKTVVLNNIFFDTDRFVLKPESEPELLKLKIFLTQNPNLRIRIEGHTDNQGDRAHNQTLSENRAQAVKQWLIAHDVPAERLGAKGFADTQPIATNDSPEGRAQNRRTAFRILP